MGTAMDSTLYCDERGNGAMPWMTAECIERIIPRMAAGCDVWTPHVYLGQNDQVHRDVLLRQKFPSFVRAAQMAGKPLVLGETGALYQGGTYEAQMASALDSLGIDRCWMIRWWTPTQYTVPSIPARVPYSPAPAPTETPTNPPVESNDPSDPAQEPPDEPEEPQEPAVIEEPVEDPPAVVEPPIEPPSPPAANDPEGGADEGETSSPGEAVPQDPSEPTPETGRGLVLVQVVRWAFEIMIRMFKRKR
jgi:hypothetical protein